MHPRRQNPGYAYARNVNNNSKSSTSCCKRPSPSRRRGICGCFDDKFISRTSSNKRILAMTNDSRTHVADFKVFKVTFPNSFERKHNTSSKTGCASAILNIHSFCKLVQRIFKYNDVQNNRLTSDEVINVLVYGTPSYVIFIQEFLKVHIFGCT